MSVVVPGATRRIVTENSVYVISAAEDGSMSYVRLPRAEAPRGTPYRMLVDFVTHELAGWALEDNLWGFPGVLALRLWGPHSVAGVFTSPVVEIDGAPAGPVPPIWETRTNPEVHVVLDDLAYRPVYVEVHGVLPEGRRPC